MRLKFIGGAKTVTGSCFLLQGARANVLVDCGLYQGERADAINREPFPFAPRDIDAILVTHAHLDHAGLLPKIVREGFRGPIITTRATRDLLEIMLADAAHIQESDAAWKTKRAMRAGKEPVLPLYTIEDVEKTLPLCDVKPYGTVFPVAEGFTCQFLDAGHILGSGTVELSCEDGGKVQKIVFSGDIGKKGNPIVRDPEVPVEADYVIMEATYGNRRHKPLKESIDELVFAVKTTFQKGGNVYIPSFAVGRTQDLLYIFNELVREKRLHDLHVYLDSPLAEEATKIYLAHPEVFDEEAMKKFGMDTYGDALHLHVTQSVHESMALNRIKSGIIVIAGSGMCEGGRIQHHLKHHLWRKECCIIFVGYQGRGTLGREIVDGAHAVKILGEEIAVKASVYTINGFSAHADQAELIDWLSHFRKSPDVFIVHAEEDVALSFSARVRDTFGYRTHVPEKGTVVEL